MHYYILYLVSRLPDWFPGTGFKKTAKAWAETLNEILEKPHRFVKEQLVNIRIHMQLFYHLTICQ
jgi:hypothetical protein